MFSLKQSFADCSSCPLLNTPSCILETNSPDDLSKIDIVFVSENPGKNEVEKEIPLIGRAGKTFRKYFDKYVKKNTKWLLTNCVLCLTLDEKGNTGNPTDDVIDRCKNNCFRIIEEVNPKLIVVMGTSPMKAFGIAKSGITDLRGQMFKWNGYDVLLTVHPSFVNRNRSYEDKFEEDIITAANMVSKQQIQGEASLKQSHTTGVKGIHRYQIPEKFYTDDYRLVDIQLLKNGEVLYIFRDFNNQKVYHKESDNYVCYQAPQGIAARKIVSYDLLEQLSLPYKQKSKLDPEITYEGDMRITAKHAIDYYHHNKEEAKRVDLNVMFFDIEIDQGIDNRAFPKPEEAKHPICLITSMYHGRKICYILDNGSEPITVKDVDDLKVFKTEKTLLMEFITDFKNTDPDFLVGWNSIAFDLSYIFNRMPKIKIPHKIFSKFGEFYVDGFRYTCKLPGCVTLDQLHLYKSYTFTMKENYKLGFIAQDELKIDKVELDVPINEMYWKRLNQFIEYNIRDVEIIEKLEDKLKHINLANELRVICTSSFEAASSQFGQIDCIMVSFLKSQGLASKNSNPHIVKEKYPGAYVHPPVPGIYNNITDFDFTALYPSLIMTYNIGVNNFIMRTVDPQDGFDLIENIPPPMDDYDIDIIIDPMFSAKHKKISILELLRMVKEQNLIHTINGCFYTSHEKELSVYSQVLNNLLSSRRDYKKRMLDAKEEGDKETATLYDTRQLVYKVLANSLYGVIANKAFRFFDVSCAAAITLGGQEALKYSLIEGDEIMKHLKGNTKQPKRALAITKQEMYSKEMPNRNFEHIITGDTDSIFCCFEKFPGKITNESISFWCDCIQDYLNKEIIEEIVQKHNVPLEFNKLNLKNELIISRGIFLAKKRYVIHVTNNEGRNVDEVKFLGIEVRRSDYPSASKEFMKELVDIILKSEKISLPMINQFVARKEKEFIALIKKGDKSIARPVTFGKNLKDYKTLTQGVKAMLAFNDISYNAHMVGSRAYMFRASGVDMLKAPQDVIQRYNKFLGEGKKLEVVAIPDEEPCLPDYYIIDIKGNLKFAFEDRYQLLLAPLHEVKKQQEIMTI